ncbi:MAG TPA: hypothetical protein VEZ89_10795, partial [Rubrivivax sp.]|nr:hypothetical protein [Rubrivivax sp.]
MTVTVNGVAVPSTQNTVEIQNGDTVAVSANKKVAWVTAPPEAGLSGLTSADQSWTARIGNAGTSPTNYTLRADASSTSFATLTFALPAGDARNGEYKLFATNGAEYLLRFNFGLRQYRISQAAVITEAGEFSQAEDGTYVFAPSSTPAPTVNNARFRFRNGLVVGAHRLGGNEAVAFIAGNNFITAAADLPPTNMWVFNTTQLATNTPPSQSYIFSIRLSGGNITYCSVAVGAITTVERCLPENLTVYPLTFNADRSITWSDSSGSVRLHVLRACDELIMVRAETTA